MLLIQGKWEKYGDSRRQDIDIPRGGNIMGYVINKNDEDSHFVDRFYCPKTGPCSSVKAGASLGVFINIEHSIQIDRFGDSWVYRFCSMFISNQAP